MRAANQTATSAFSQVFSFITAPVITVPAVPVLLAPINDAVNQPVSLTFTWLPSTGAAHYRMQVSLSADFSILFVNDSLITSVSHQVTTLHYSTTYYWRVSASNSAGTSAFSAPFRFTTEMGVPVELTAFTATVRGNGIELRWSTATEKNNSGFEVQRKTEGEWKQIGFVAGAGTTTEPKEYQIFDSRPAAGANTYRLLQKDYDGGFSLSPVIEVRFLPPSGFSLEQNYPNPFNPVTRIQYSIPSEQPHPHSLSWEEREAGNTLVRLSVYDILGREVATLVNEEKSAGHYTVLFNASSLPSGTYFYELRAGEFRAVRKMILLK